MSDWLSSTWEANWKSFQYFNFYRLIVAAVLVGMGLFSFGWASPFRLANPWLFNWVGVAYVLTTGAGVMLSIRYQRYFNRQLSCQVLADVLAVNLLMYVAGGLSSGLGVLLLVSLAAASLVGRGRLVLFYAALATLAVLCMQIYGLWTQHFETYSVVQAGLLSVGFFATAILARLLGQRLMVNEELARRRGIALDNQTRINQRVIERMQDGVLVVGRDGRVHRHNPVAETMLGVSRGDEVGLAEYSLPLAEAFFAWLADRRADSAEFSGAGERSVRARFEPTESTDGEVLVFLEDVGRVQARAQQLKLAALGRLTASIAHEIRNPLAAISHAGDLLREERRGEAQDRLLRILNDNVGRLDRIVQDVLELGRRDRVQLESLRLDEFVLDFAEEFVRTEGIDPTVVNVEIERPGSICFDRSHLHQVLWNLTGNAVRHSRRMPGSVRLRLSAADGEGQVELHVIDDGPGVPEAIGAQVFEPFFTTHHKGTGLGLFIARELCEANGARLELAPAASCGHFILAGRRETCKTHDPNVAFAAN